MHNNIFDFEIRRQLTGGCGRQSNHGKENNKKNIKSNKIKIKIIKRTEYTIIGIFSTLRSVARLDARWVWQTFKAHASSPEVVGLGFYLGQWLTPTLSISRHFVLQFKAGHYVLDHLIIIFSCIYISSPNKIITLVHM